MRFKTLLMAVLTIVATANTAQAMWGDGTLRDFHGTKIKYLHETPTRVRINATRLLEFRSDVYGDRQEYPSVVAQIYPNGEIRYIGRRQNVRAFQPDMLRYVWKTGVCNNESDYSPGKCLALEKQRNGDIQAVAFETRRVGDSGIIDVLQGMFITSYGNDRSCTRREIRDGIAYCDIGGRSSVWGLTKRLAEDERDDSVIYTRETEVY